MKTETHNRPQKDITIAALVDKEQYERVRLAAYLENCSMAEIIRRACDSYLEIIKKRQEAA